MKYILAIETSCDETAASVVNFNSKSAKILSNIVSSQIKTHQKYGGVVPEVASRMHLEVINNVIKLALKKAKITFSDIDNIAVTSDPGLIGSLLIGQTAAKTLSLALENPVLEINHIDGHFSSALIKDDSISLSDLKSYFPMISLLVSGGHSQLVLSKKLGSFKIIGETLDDAAGEAFDKAAQVLGLSYPGGPAISNEAEKVSKADEKYELPVPMKDSDDLNLSFSGLKTALLYKVLKYKKIDARDKAQFARSFQDSLVESLVLKTIKAAKKYKPKTITLAGGVAANKYLREQLSSATKSLNPSIPLLVPDFQYCTDNAAMIGIAAAIKLNSKVK